MPVNFLNSKIYSIIRFFCSLTRLNTFAFLLIWFNIFFRQIHILSNLWFYLFFNLRRLIIILIERKKIIITLEFQCLRFNLILLYLIFRRLFNQLKFAFSLGQIYDHRLFDGKLFILFNEINLAIDSYSVFTIEINNNHFMISYNQFGMFLGDGSLVNNNCSLSRWSSNYVYAFKKGNFGWMSIYWIKDCDKARYSFSIDHIDYI